MRLPFVKQDDSKDCGVSCLLMIIRYYKGNIPRERLREITKTTKDGTLAYHLIDAAKKLHFSAVGVKGNVDDLGRRDLPCIAHVVIEEKYQHYIVIYKLNSKKLLIADPARALQVITKEDFKKISTGVFLLFSPQKKIPEIGINHELKPFLLSFLLSQKRQILSFVLFSIGCFCLSLLGTFQLKYLLESVIGFDSKYNLLFYVVFFVVVNVIQTIFQIVQFSLAGKIHHQLGRNLYQKVYIHLTSLPYLYYRNHSTGEIMARLFNLEKLEQTFQSTFLLLFTEIPFFLIITCVLGILKIEIVFILVAFLFLSYFSFFPLEFFGEKKMKDAKQKTEEIHSYLTESFLGIETIQAFNEQEKFQNRFFSIYYSYKKSQISFLKNWNLQHILESFMEKMFMISLLVLCSLEVLDGRMSVSDLILYHSLCTYLLEPIKHFKSYQLEYREARDAWNRIEELFMIPREKLLPDWKRKKLRIEKIELEEICYSYNAKNQVLDHLTFEIEKGQKILVYGASGGGKSTLARLLSRILEPDQGRILLNGNDIKNYSLSLIREKILYVPQKGYLFTTSVLENINGRDEKEILEKTLEVGKLCMVDELVSGKLEGYHWIIEENGYNLSGGERQRIILARSLFKRASVYIFDESFSELDPIKERKILENIFARYPEKTMIMISHRERNQDLFHKKVYLEKGKIYEEVESVS